MDQPVAHLASYRINMQLKEIEIGQVVSTFRELTGESEKDCLEMAGKEITEGNLISLLHFAIIQVMTWVWPTR